MALAIPVILVTPGIKETDSGANKPLDQTKIEIGGSHVISRVHNRIILGDSLAQRDVKRDTIARDRPSPGYGNDTKVKKLWPDKTNNCVIWATSYTGIHKRIGYAGTAKADTQTPQVGIIALFRNYGHVGVVTQIEGDTLTVIDSNWVKGWITEHKMNKNQIRGYIQ